MYLWFSQLNGARKPADSIEDSLMSLVTLTRAH